MARRLSFPAKLWRTSLTLLSCALVLAGMAPPASAFGFGFGGRSFGGSAYGGRLGGSGGLREYGGGYSSYGPRYGGSQAYGGRSFAHYPRPYGDHLYGDRPYGERPQASTYPVRNPYPGHSYPGHSYPGNAYPEGRQRWPHPRPRPWHPPVYGAMPDPRPLPVAIEPQAEPNRGIRPVPPSMPVAREVPKAPAPPPRPARARSGAPAADEKRYVPDEVIVTVSGTPAQTKSLGDRHGLTLISSRPISLIGGGSLNRYRIGDKRPVPEVIRELETETQVTWAQPNYIFKLSDSVEISAKGQDTTKSQERARGLAGAQYILKKLNLPDAHRLADGSHTRVAVIDSGIDEQHGDLAGAVVERFDSVGGPIASHAHGTAMAGAIGAHGALTGVAPHADLLAVRAFTGGDSKPGADGTTAHIVDALEWAATHKARIINMSFAGPFDALISLALKTAHDRDIVLVAAAGNEGPGAKPAFPASDRTVIAVTATDRNDKIFSAANRGSYIALAAPGTDVIAAAPSNNYQFTSGTSIAAAHISGVIALLLSEKPDLSAESVRRILKDTARDLGQADEFGAGLGDAGRATAVVKILRDEGEKQDGQQKNVSEAQPKTTAAR